ncbi:MAG: D-alanine--D-alanine ligase [Chloroflexi bacterium]|nr:D-alanine--D-alanine ligase [Chloroflexota bacterium]
MPNQRVRVGVIFGGRSGEHEVSIESARSVLSAIDSTRYEAIPIGITHEGAWYAVEPAALLAGRVEPGVRLLASADPGATGLVESNGPKQAGHKGLDVAFPLLHGTFGEDGCIQGLLELAGIPYVGAGVLGSAVGMDKILMKRVFAACGLPQVPYLEVARYQWERDPALVRERVGDAIGFPCFVKPAGLGSSVGITRVGDDQRLGPALDAAAEFGSRIVVEQGVEARELECGVLGNEEPLASVVGEVVFARDFYDYEAKYYDERTRLTIPADLDEGTGERIRELAVAAFLAIGAAGMARVDFFLERKTGALFVNEINTIPGFTAFSAYPRLWEASGVAYPELIGRLIELALARHADESRNRTRYEV